MDLQLLATLCLIFKVSLGQDREYGDYFFLSRDYDGFDTIADPLTLFRQRQQQPRPQIPLPTEPCVDSNLQCVFWAERGDCRTNPTSVPIACPCTCALVITRPELFKNLVDKANIISGATARIRPRPTRATTTTTTVSPPEKSKQEKRPNRISRRLEPENRFEFFRRRGKFSSDSF